MNMVMAEDPAFEPNKRFKLDMFNVVIGNYCAMLPYHFANVPGVVDETAVIGNRYYTLVIIVIILKRTWWNKLEN